jgi:hypothetical protein
MLHHNKITSSGFALLITLVIISVVISIGITLIDLTIKQLRLANSSKDSESAFHAANAGAECIRYWRIASSTAFESVVGVPVSVPVTCFGEVATSSVPTNLGTGVHRHDLEITWGPSNARRCSEVIMLTLSSDPSAVSSTTLNNIQNQIPGYPTNYKECGPGGRCSIISVRGYNRSCALKNELGSIQREVLLDL